MLSHNLCLNPVYLCISRLVILSQVKWLSNWSFVVLMLLKLELAQVSIISSMQPYTFDFLAQIYPIRQSHWDMGHLSFKWDGFDVIDFFVLTSYCNETVINRSKPNNFFEGGGKKFKLKSKIVFLLLKDPCAQHDHRQGLVTHKSVLSLNVLMLHMVSRVISYQYV